MDIISTYSLLPLSGSIFVLVLGFFVWFKKPRKWLHILFFLYAFTIALWLFGTFKLFNATVEQEQIFWDRFIYVGVVFIPIFLYHFGLLYCEIKRQNLFLVAGYLLAFVFLPLSQFSENFVSGIYRYKWGVHTVAQPLHSLFLIFFFFYFIFFFVNLCIHYKKSVGQRKKQVGYVLLGYGILDLIGPLAFLPAYGVPIYPIVFLSAIPFALILAYAIIRHNALEVKIITAEVVVTMLNLIALAEVFFSQSATELILRAVALLAILFFSVVLVRSVHKEIQRREEITNLAHSLEKANLRLQELDRQKTDFLSIASHQLRTPLSILKGYIELIKDGAFGKPTAQLGKTLDDMDESNEHLVKLVDEFLDITRIEQGRVKYTFKDGNINSLIANVIKELAERAAKKNLSLVWKPNETFKKINMDEEKIHHVVFNFVDNAIKYSEHGEIKIIAVKEEGGISVKVSDDGIGFEMEDEANFFQKFYRGKNVTGTNVNGTGLGLYVCKKFIEAHNGRVWSKSAGLGRGSEFGFWIPLRGTGDVGQRNGGQRNGGRGTEERGMRN